MSIRRVVVCVALLSAIGPWADPLLAQDLAARAAEAPSTIRTASDEPLPNEAATPTPGPKLDINIEAVAGAAVAPAMPVRHSRALWSLYAATVVTQALDVHSTRNVLNSGGREANPALRGIAGNTPAFIAMKAAVASGTILATRQIARTHKTAAILALVGINSGYAILLAHNYAAMRRVQ
ncbi:MAG: DUF5658 family protein [Vicinamibacterales bacterium]